jgi:sulfide:quinone oxidoreductase
MSSEAATGPVRVVVAGAGVAGLEALLALRDLAGSRVAITLLAPGSEFVYTPLSVREPFAGRYATRYPLDRIAADTGVEWVGEGLASVAPDRHVAVTESGRELPYDALVVAVGARRETVIENAVTFSSGEDSEAMHGLVQDVEEGYSRRIAFVVPPGITWPLPLYELALMTAERAHAMGADVELTLLTPESAPLEVFGPAASAELARLLEEAGIAIETGVEAGGDGRAIAIEPGGRRLEADRVVALPVLHGPALAGLPADADGFIPVGPHGQVVGAPDVYAAGDGVQFPIKQGGVATQQADAIAAAIAARAGAAVEAPSERPVLRGMLLTGGAARFLRGRPGGEGASESAARALWWPPAKIAGRYLAPYLAQAGDQPLAPPPEAADALHVEILLGSGEQPRVRRGGD